MGSVRRKTNAGYDFHRQKPLLNYIADFYCPELNLVIEIDGYSHEFEETQIRDKRKEIELKKWGITVLRFRDERCSRGSRKCFEGNRTLYS